MISAWASVVGYMFSSLPGVQVAHLPARSTEPEVDFVLTVGDARIPVEVKYQTRISLSRDAQNIMSFLARTVNNASFGLLITQAEWEVADLPIVAVPLKHLLMMR